MADAALKAGIAWKKAVVQERLGAAVSEYARHAQDPTAEGQSHLPSDEGLIKAHVEELKKLETPNKAAWKLVKANLERAIEKAMEDLAQLNGVYSHRPHIYPGGDDLARLRRTIDDLKRKLKALEDEGEPN